MKKIIMIVSLFIFLLISACTTTKNCKGGGWYDKDRFGGIK